ncbi:cysteine hydrolase family protein [Azohydromonas caseinilytica]|uniref:Cysteine hydrolase n=1 Tax=Azohydromonas caseinilytica TaxID=2728836 RepID=A0A848FIY2_9BURK|nr:cysteine hydrolase family protein [Azohydromonas caseinilytica]NML18855.1 cysteine hydrolase [Azohydromonas caseinilytica]
MTTLPRRALIVIDVQNEYVSGNLPIGYPDIDCSLAKVGHAMDAARAAGIPVVVVQHGTPPGTPIFARGSHGWELHPVVASRPRDHLVQKEKASAFEGTDLEAWLRERGIGTVTVAGYMTHNCVDTTVKHALLLGLAAEVLADATGSPSYANRAGAASARQIHESFMVVMQSGFANVMATQEWVAALQGAPLPERGSIFASSQAARATARLQPA